MPERPGTAPRRSTTRIRILAFALAGRFSPRCSASPVVGRHSSAAPVISAYGGDAARAMAAYAGWRLLRPTDALLATAGLASLAAFTIEISPLFRIDWLDTIRPTRLGTLLLGRGFLWSDLVAFAVGTVAATELDAATRRPAGPRAD